MTDAEWLTSQDAWAMLHAVQQSSPSERKVRLFNSAVCGRFWDYLPEASQAILLKSELLADGQIQVPLDDMELCGLANNVVAVFDRQYPQKQFPSREVRIQRDAAAAVCYAVVPKELWGAASYFWEIDEAEKYAHCEIIRDIFDNPFRPVTIDPSWVTPVVVALAQSIYNDRVFDRMSEVADALEAAGCTETHMLEHCRGSGPHVRGCWVLDVILGKA